MTEKGTRSTGPAGPTVQKLVVFSAAVLLFVAGSALAIAAGPDRPYKSSGIAPIVSDRPVDSTPVAASPQVPLTSGTGDEEPRTTAKAPQKQASSRPQNVTRDPDPAPRDKKREAAKDKKDKGEDDDDKHETVVPKVRDEDDDEDDDKHETVVPKVRDEDDDDSE